MSLIQDLAGGTYVPLMFSTIRMESLVAFGECRTLPGHPDRKSLERWSRNGILNCGGRVRLEKVCIGKLNFTSREAYARFLMAINRPRNIRQLLFESIVPLSVVRRQIPRKAMAHLETFLIGSRKKYTTHEAVKRVLERTTQ